MNSETALVWWVCLGLVAFAVAVSAAGMWRLAPLRRAAAAAGGWQSVAGRILDTEIRERHVHETGLEYLVVPTYAYRVGGRDYWGTRLTLGPPAYFSTRRGAERRAAAFPAGAPVTVYHDPADPAQAVLERRAPFATTVVVLLALGWVITLVVVAVLLLAPGLAGSGPVLRL